MQPFCNIYSSFMQRAYDNVIHDIALLRLPVVLCLDRAGLVGEDGPTHHGVFDLAYFRPIPNLTISSPMDEHELRRLMYTAQLPDQGPFVIRYPRGRGVLLDWKCPLEEIPRRQRAQTERRQRPGSHHPRSHRQRGRTCHRACGEGQRNLHSPLRPAFSQAARRSPAARGGTQLPACRHHRRRCQKKEEWAVPYWSSWRTMTIFPISDVSVYPMPS